MVVAYLGSESGVSKKSGEGYTFVYYAYSSNRIKGQGADKVYLSADSGIKLPDGIEPGEALNLEFNSRGFLVGLDRI